MRSLLAPALISALFLALTLPLVFRERLDTFDTIDETVFHYPTILTFAEQFPRINFANYNSATTPLYHVLMALPAVIFGSDLTQLRLLNALISWLVLVLIYAMLRRRGGALTAVYFTVLFLLSAYFIGASARLATDNLALLCAVAAIWLMSGPTMTFRRALLAALLIGLAILTRQTYVWLVGAFIFINLQQGDDWPSGQAIGRAALALIPLGCLAYFLILWRGLTPPAFAGEHAERLINWDAPVYIISLLGFFASFFIVWLYRAHSLPIWQFGLLTIAASLYLLIHPVTNDYDRVMRGGALWLAATHLPTFAGSSILFWLLFPFGLCCGYLVVRQLLSQRELLICSCLILFTLVYIFNAKTHQKYYEPFLLFALGYSLVPVDARGWLSWAGPLLLLALFTGIALTRFF
jgi:4-amino-4-deoxy-L-arabinose transferase-like glycosyltransferase